MRADEPDVDHTVWVVDPDDDTIFIAFYVEDRARSRDPVNLPLSSETFFMMNIRCCFGAACSVSRFAASHDRLWNGTGSGAESRDGDDAGRQ